MANLGKWKEFANLLAEYLRQKDLTATWIARQIRTDPSTVNKWIRENERPGERSTVEKIADVFQLTEQERLQLLKASGYAYTFEVAVSQKANASNQQVITENDADLDLPLGSPRSYVPYWGDEPFLKFSYYQHLIGRIYEWFFTEGENERQFFVLQGDLGTGKSRVAHEVASRLKEAGHFVVFHQIDHITDDENSSDAINELTEHLADCLNAPTTKKIEDQEKIIEKVIGERGCKLILTGLHKEIEPKFIKFLTSTLKSIKVLITNDEKFTPELADIEEVPNIEQGAPTLEFLVACGVARKRTEKDVQPISKRTGGNSFALRQMADFLSKNEAASVGEILKTKAITLDEQVKAFSEDELSLLKALSLFRGTVDRSILVAIAWPELSTEERKAKFEGIDKKLRDQGVLLGVLPKDGKFTRFQMLEPYRTHVWTTHMDDQEERQSWKRRWVQVYKGLRPVEPYVEWAIFTDYLPDDDVTIRYTDEIGTIIDVIKYCISDERDEETEREEDLKEGKFTKSYWIETATWLVNSFRFALYATGKWAMRSELCEKVITKLKKHDSRSPFVIELDRQIAWIQCFQDEYVPAVDRAKGALEDALARIQKEHNTDKVSSLSDRDRNTFWATYYKTLDTLGRIYLRQGQNAVNWGHFFEKVKDSFDKKSDEDILNSLTLMADLWFEKANTHFEGAKLYFNRAMGFVSVAFPSEIPFAEYLLAEVDYYNRHVNRGRKANYENDSLNTADKDFVDALLRWERNHSGKRHNRLTAHVNYYSGKANRRLRSDNKADKKLKDAEEKAEEFADSVLGARVKFALGQLCEQKVQDAWRDGLEAKDLIDRYRELVKDAAVNLHKLGMKIEWTDAVAFLLRPIKKAAGTKGIVKKDDIPPDLLRAFENRFRNAMNNHEKEIPNFEEFAQIVINKVFDRQ